jgi:hypothetical protein
VTSFPAVGDEHDQHDVRVPLMDGTCADESWAKVVR